MLLPLWDSLIVLCCVLRYFVSIFYCNHLDGEEREFVALLSLSSWCLVIVVWFLRAMGLSAVCDRGIS